MNFEETEVLYNVYRGILRNNRSFQPGKSTAVEYRMDCPEYADLLKKYPIEKNCRKRHGPAAGNSGAEIPLA
mgnify:CR=1 FL=1